MAATADIMEKNMAEVSSVSKIRGVDENGNSVQIALLALLASGNVMYCRDMILGENLNDMKQTRMYVSSNTDIVKTIKNRPSDTVEGESVVFTISTTNLLYSTQFYCNITAEKVYVRFQHYGSWSSWKSISLT